MIIKTTYYGLISEITHCESEEIAFEGLAVSEFKTLLFEKYPLLKGTVFQLAQNNTILAEEATITNHEIALLPPFAGG